MDSQNTEHTTFWNIYTSIKELTLDKFIACSVSEQEDYSPLIKNAKIGANKDDLRRAWLLVLSAYYDTKQDVSVKDYIDLSKTLEAKNLRIERIQKLINVVDKQFYTNPNIHIICDLLRQEGYEHLEFTVDTYKADLAEIVNSEKINVVEILSIKDKLKQGESGNSKMPKEDDYYNMLLALRKHTKIYYKANEMTVYEFALECKRLELEIEQLNQQYGEHR